jgi:uncharacterized membrane protein HdeD (DUF308 family)
VGARARGIALLAAGAFVVLEQAMALTLVLTAIGVYLIYSGVYVLLSMINRPAEAQPAVERPGRRRAHRRGLIVAAGVVVIALGAALGGFFGSGGVKASAPDQASCNDSLALCGAIAAAGRARGDAQLDVGAVAGLVLA